MKNSIKAFFDNFFLLTDQSRAGFRTAVAVVFAIYMAFLLHLSQPYWAVISVVVVMQPYLGNTIDKAVVRIFATFVGAMLGLFLGGFVANHLSLFILACFLILAIGYYFGMQSKYPYAYVMGSVTAYLVIGELIVNPHQPFYIAFWRTFEVYVGVVSSIVATFLIFPTNAEAKLKRLLNKAFSNQKEIFNECMAMVLADDKSSKPRIQDKALQTKKHLIASLELIKSLQREYNVDFKIIKQYQFITEQLQKLNRVLRDLMLVVCRKNHFYAFRESMIDLQVLQAIFNQAFQQIEKTVASPFTENKEFNLDEFTNYQEKINQLRAKRAFAHYPVEDNLSVFSVLDKLERIAIRLQIISELHADTVAPNKVETHKIRWNKFEFKNAIASGLGAVIALLGWMMTNMPGGIQGIISSLVVSLQKNLGDKKQVAVNRLVGCFIGGGAGLLIIAIHQVTTFELLFYEFIFAWIFGIVTFSGKRYAYVGVQANIGLAMTFVQAGGIQYMEPAVERFVGMILGIIAIFIASYLITPYQPEHLFENNLQKMANVLKTILTKGILTITENEMRNQFNTMLQISHKNVSLLNTIAYRKDPKEKEYYEKASEYFERMGSLIFHIILQKGNKDLLEIAKQYAIDLNADMNHFVELFSWLENPTKNQLDKTKSQQMRIYLQQQQENIKRINLEKDYDFTQSRELIFTYQNLIYMLDVSRNFSLLKTNVAHEVGFIAAHS